jgi:hypothetical protein
MDAGRGYARRDHHIGSSVHGRSRLHDSGVNTVMGYLIFCVVCLAAVGGMILILEAVR